MATTRLMTAEELEEMPDDGQQYELMRGELVTMAPAGRRSGKLGMEIGSSLLVHVKNNGIGEVYGADTGFILSRNPDVVLAPDASFVRLERLKDVGEDGFLPLAPDLAVEVISPSERAGHISAKVSEYLHAGVRLIWLVDPRRRIVTVYTPTHAARVLRIEDVLDGGDVLPGFSLPLAALFR
jgi:Uma2 family endonuclease